MPIAGLLLIGLLMQAPIHAEEVAADVATNPIDAALANIAGTPAGKLAEAAQQALTGNRLADAGFLIHTARLRLECDQLLYPAWWRDGGIVDEATRKASTVNNDVSYALFNAPQEFVAVAAKLGALEALQRNEGYTPGWRHDPAPKPAEATATCAAKHKELAGIMHMTAELLNNPSYVADWQIMRAATQKLRQGLTPDEVKQRNEAMDRMRAIETEKYGKVQLMPTLLARALRGE